MTFRGKRFSLTEKKSTYASLNMQKFWLLLLNFLNVISLVSAISYRKQSYEILELSLINLNHCLTGPPFNQFSVHP